MVQVDVQPYKISAADWSFGLKTKYACFNDLKKKMSAYNYPKFAITQMSKVKFYGEQVFTSLCVENIK